MVWPLLAAAAVTAGANYMNGEANRKANQKLLDQNRDLLNGVPLPELNESDYLSPEIAARLDPSRLAYGLNEYQGDYAPESASFARESDPRLVERSEAAKYGRDAQMEALKKFRSTVGSGYDPEFDAKLQQAQNTSQASAQSRMASILQDAQRRGQMGTTAMLAAQMQGSSDAMNRGAMESQQAAVEAYRNKLSQQMNAANMGRQLAGDEESFDARNTGIQNDFNQRTTRAYQGYLDQVAEQRNQAQLRNLNSRQQLSNENVGIQNRQTTDQYNAAKNERAYANQLLGERQGVRKDNFNNQISRATGNMNINNQQMGVNTSGAQDRANMIQGVGNSVGGYFQNEDAKDQQAQAQQAADRRANFQQTGSWTLPSNYRKSNDDEG